MTHNAAHKAASARSRPADEPKATGMAGCAPDAIGRSHGDEHHGHPAAEQPSYAAPGLPVHRQAGVLQPGAGPDPVERAARSILPSVSSVVQAGAFGAALGGMTTGVMEMARVKQGEITTEEAIRNVVKSSAQGAATMAVASVASQVVRSHPVFGFIALAAAGIGAFVILSGANAGPAAHAAPAADPPARRKPATSKKRTQPSPPPSGS